MHPLRQGHRATRVFIHGNGRMCKLRLRRCIFAGPDITGDALQSGQSVVEEHFVSRTEIAWSLVCAGQNPAVLGAASSADIEVPADEALVVNLGFSAVKVALGL